MGGGREVFDQTSEQFTRSTVYLVNSFGSIRTKKKYGTYSISSLLPRYVLFYYYEIIKHQ